MRKTETYTLKIYFEGQGKDWVSGRVQHVRTGRGIIFKDIETLKDFLTETSREPPEAGDPPAGSPKHVREKPPGKRRNEP